VTLGRYVVLLVGVAFFHTIRSFWRMAPAPTIPIHANPCETVMELIVAGMILLLALLTWGLYRLAVNLKEPS
jgi:hypothetical protein